MNISAFAREGANLTTDKLGFDQIIKTGAEKKSYQADWDRQRKSAKAVLERFDNGYDSVLLADEVGMGKTYVALCVIAEHILQREKNDRKVILITPPSSVLRAKWEQEILSFNEKYVLSLNPERKLRPIKVDGYWDLVQNLQDYNNQTHLNRVSEEKRNYFLFCLFLWGVKKEKASWRRNMWEPLEEFNAESPGFLAFRSIFSLQAMFSYFDEVNANQDRRLFRLIDRLYKKKVPDGEIKKLFRDFAWRQDHYEANVFIMGMNSLKRPRSDKYENRLFNTFVLGLLLAGTRETTRKSVLEVLEKTNIILQRNKHERLEKYYNRVFGLSSGDYYGLKNVTEDYIKNGPNIQQKWTQIRTVIGKKRIDGVADFFKDLADAAFQAKLKQAGIDLAVVDEVHNWKNGKLGAVDFRRNFSPYINRKLIMSATPFQIQEKEMQTIFGYVQKPKGLTEQTLNRLYIDGSLLVDCLNASDRFRKAWINISNAEASLGLLIDSLDSVANKGIESWLAGSINNHDAGEVLYEFVDAIQTYRQSIMILRTELSNIIIRHTKCKDKRHFHIGSKYSLQCLSNPDQYRTLYPAKGYANEGDAFVNFVAMRLDQLIRRDSGKGYGASAHLMGGITSSTGAFLESSQRLEKEIKMSKSTREYRDLFQKILTNHVHPKVMATVERAFQNYKEGRKTLIFCERCATLRDIARELKNKTDSYLNAGSSPDGLKRETVLKNHAFVDNMWWWSLLETLDRDQQEKWKAFTHKNLPAAAKFSGELIQRAGVKPTPRRIILLLDLYLVHAACADGIPKVFKTAEHAIKLFIHHNSSLELAKLLITGDKTATKEVIGDMEDDTESEVAIIADSYAQGANLWIGQGAHDLHKLIWELLESEAVKLLSAGSSLGGGHLDEISSSFADIMVDLIGGLRKISLRPDLLSRYGRFSKAESHIDRIREGFRTMPIGNGTVVTRIVDFLMSLIESNGTINQLDKQSSKRRSLWQGVFLRKDGYVEMLDGEVKSETRVTLCAAFNSPLAPDILVCTSIGSEGIDLHRNCAEVIHHDLPWNPAKLEQRIGRVDRVGSLAENSKDTLIHIGIPFLAHNYEQFQYDLVHSRAQSFEILMGRPEYSMEDVDEEVFSDSDESAVNNSQETNEVGNLQIFAPLPGVLLDYLKVDLSV
jgi:superfamily II DNA or RNA helicase